MKRKVITLLTVFLISIFSMSICFADDLNDAQGKLNSSKSKIGDLNSKISDIKKQKTDVTTEINSMDQQMNDIQKKIDDYNSKIASKQGEIKVATDELDKTEEDFKKQKQLYATRIRAMYMNGSAGYLEILLSADSFSDFVSRADVVKKVMNYDRSIIQKIKDKQKQIEDKKKVLVADNAQLVKLQKDTTTQKNQMSGMENQKKQLFAKLDSNQKTLEDEVAAEKKSSDALSSQIKSILASRASTSGNSSRGGSSGTYSGSKSAVLKVGGPITCPFGPRIHPITGRYEIHTGVDIGVPTGTAVFAMSSGTVIISEGGGAYGNHVVIDHGSGITSLYGHCSKLLVSVGQHVSAGQEIAISGSTGWSTGPHLHFEVDVNGNPVNPMPYY